MRSAHSHALLAGAVCFGLAALTAARAQAADVTLQGVTIVQGDTKILFRTIEATDTNLTHDELAKLFSKDISPTEAAALATRMKAAKLSIPETTISVKGGTIALHDFVASDIDSGHAGKIALGGIDGAVTPPGSGPSTLHANPLLVEGVDFASVLAAARSGDAADLHLHVRHLDWQGFDFTATDKDVPPKAAGGNLWHVHLNSLEAKASYDGDVPLVGAATMKDLTLTAPPASDAGKTLASLGYDKLDFGASFSGSYDATARRYSIDDYSISEARSGTLALKGQLGSIDKAAFTGSKETRLVALLNGELASVSLRFDDAGLFDKALAYFAAQQGSTPQDLRGQWAAAATQFIPVLLGGDPAALKIAAAANTFIRDPKNLTIAGTAKGEPIKFMEFAAMKEDPSALLDKVNIEASADGAPAHP